MTARPAYACIQRECAMPRRILNNVDMSPSTARPEPGYRQIAADSCLNSGEDASSAEHLSHPHIMTGSRDSFGESRSVGYDGKPRQRASQACLPVSSGSSRSLLQRASIDSQCHRRKLKCSGDWPCKRCAGSGADCQFGQGVNASGSTATVAHDRLQQLEQTVSTLVSAMTSAKETRNRSEADFMQVHLPPIWERVSAFEPGSSSHPTATNMSPHLISPQCSPQASVSTAGAAPGKRLGKHQAAEERLELATKPSFEPPFRPLTYAVRVQCDVADL
jgi:hypothetical protein